MQKQSFNKGWTFNKGGGGALMSLAGGAAAGKEVCVPHDASVGMTRNPEEPNGSGNGFFREENYNYTKNFSMAAEDEGKNIWLEFEGVYQNAFVYVNNSYVGKCH